MPSRAQRKSTTQRSSKSKRRQRAAAAPAPSAAAPAAAPSAAPSAERPLTPKQRRFCLEYVVDLNGSAAYRRSGYRAKTDLVSRVEASKLLAKPNIRSEIARLQAERDAQGPLSADWVISRLRREADHGSHVLTVPAGPRVKALELLGKVTGVLRDERTVTHAGTVGHAHAVAVAELPPQMQRQLLQHLCAARGLHLPALADTSEPVLIEGSAQPAAAAPAAPAAPEESVRALPLS